MVTKQKDDILVQMYDYSQVKEYYKIFKGFIFSSAEKIRADVLENYLELNVKTTKLPDRLFINGEEYKFKKLTKII